MTLNPMLLAAIIFALGATFGWRLARLLAIQFLLAFTLTLRTLLRLTARCLRIPLTHAR